MVATGLLTKACIGLPRRHCHLSSRGRTPSSSLLHWHITICRHVAHMRAWQRARAHNTSTCQPCSPAHALAALLAGSSHPYRTYACRTLTRPRSCLRSCCSATHTALRCIPVQAIETALTGAAGLAFISIQRLTLILRNHAQVEAVACTPTLPLLLRAWTSTPTSCT